MRKRYILIQDYSLRVKNEYTSEVATSTLSSDHSTPGSSSGSAILTDTVCNHES